jgi:hypothetical protein
VKVVLLFGKTQTNSIKAEEDIFKTYHLHANCYITKPVDFEQFPKVEKAIDDFWFSMILVRGKLMKNKYNVF